MKVYPVQHIQIKDYDYHLPDDKIAKYPLKQRDQSKLLVYRSDTIEDAQFKDIAEYLPENSLLIFNNTRVIQARLFFKKDTGAQIEIFCLEPRVPNDYLLNFQQTASCSWFCLIGNSKKWKEGKLHKEIQIGDIYINVSVSKEEWGGGSQAILFEWDNTNISFADILEACGELPIPPYLNRRTEEADNETYQTVYSKIKGSVAAPTAGLHFTPKVIGRLKKKGILTNEVTLHVGAGTFKPVKSDEIRDHLMHSEYISVRKELIEQLLTHKGKIIAVGTTSVRTLESIYYIGELLENTHCKILTVEQWQPYKENNNKISIEKSLQNIINYLDKKGENILIANTQIMIAPGYKFKIVDGIVTNFHQPKSTLLLLISAYVGDNNRKKIYTHALDNNYRFLSYGDSSLLLKE